MDFRLAYLELALTLSQSKGQGHVQVDCEYLENVHIPDIYPSRVEYLTLSSKAFTSYHPVELIGCRPRRFAVHGDSETILK